jgi:CheY-like chemotaxis protein
MALILIIDDSSYQRRLIRRFIEAKGHQIIEAVNGRDGLEMITTHTPDCVLLDLIMPEASGFDLLETLQQQNIKIPVVVITADVQTSTHRQCKELGAAAIINKPVDSEQLFEVIDQILDSEK